MESSLPVTLFGSLSMPPFGAESKKKRSDVKIKVELVGELRDSFFSLSFPTRLPLVASFRVMFAPHENSVYSDSDKQFYFLNLVVYSRNE